jgi:tetratricopeptide (TPR) repeat protein
LSLFPGLRRVLGPVAKFVVGLVLGLIAGMAAPQEGWAQQHPLPLKVDVPPAAPGPCEVDQLVTILEQPASADARAQARERLTEANQAALLGEDDRARLLLRQAAGFDPTNAEVAYRLARLLEAVGERDAAVLEFCRVSLVDPDGPDTPDARGRIEALAGRDEGQVPGIARVAFQRGVSAVREARFEDAVLHFSRALVEAPTWPDAHYNRALAHLGAGRTGAGVADLDRYLELSPDAPDGARVRAQRSTLAPTPGPIYSPRTTLVSGLVLPGMGHFYSGRPTTGLLVLAAAGAGVGLGLGYVDAKVTCLVPPIDGVCPVGQVDTRTESRPLLVPGLLAAGVATVVGAIHAYRSVRAPSVGDWGTPDPRRAGSVGLRPDGTVAVGVGALRGGTWSASLELGSAGRTTPPGVPEPRVMRGNAPAMTTGSVSAALRLYFP